MTYYITQLWPDAFRWKPDPSAKVQPCSRCGDWSHCACYHGKCCVCNSSKHDGGCDSCEAEEK